MLKAKLAPLFLAAAAMMIGSGCATVAGKRNGVTKSTATPSTSPFSDAERPMVRVSPNGDDPLTTLATVRSTRTIAMFYRLDLRADNAHSPVVSQVLQQNDGRLRSCYLNRLERSPALRGQVTLAFKISKANGTMGRILHVSGTLKDKALVRCLKEQLAALPFAPPPRDMRGTLTYQFDTSAPVLTTSR